MSTENPSQGGFLSVVPDLLLALVISGIAIFTIQHFELNRYLKGNTNTVQLEEEAESICKFGFDMNAYFFNDLELKADQFLGDILYYEGVDFAKIAQLEKNSKDVYSVRKLKAGKNLTFVRPDSCAAPVSFIYEPDVFSYIVYDLKDSMQVSYVEKDVTTIVESASGEVETSLWNAMIENNLEPAMIDKMEDALASSVDFYHAKTGDQFKLIFERKYIDNKAVGVGKLLAANYKNSYGEHYSIHYKSGNYEGYFDLEGRATKRAFLKAPVKYSRISSRYNKNRLHPIKKRRIPHLGTDYAAAYGTPIHAVANGTIVTASYGRGNGKYIKIKHNKTYQTQYLHMQRFAKGMRKGVRVSQGQVIGYVGSTGLATGPHVCYRFWKNGKQVDPLRENFPPAKPMSKDELPDYMIKKDEMKYRLDAIPMNLDHKILARDENDLQS